MSSPRPRGAAIARRLARAGYDVRIGSRDAARAQASAAELSASAGARIGGGANAEVAAAAGIVVVAVPFASQAAILEELKPVVAGKIVVDTTVPLVPPKVMRVQLPPEGSAAQRAQKILGEGVTVVLAASGAPGEGSLVLPVSIAPALGGTRLILQAGLADPGAPQGLSLTQVLDLTIGL